MTTGGFYERLKLDDSLVQETGFNPYYRHLQSGLGERITLDDREFINLAANNYLGLADDARVKQAIIEAVEKYGASMCGTPIATGCSDLFRRIEKMAAAFVGLEDAVIFPSCYQANNGMFQTIAGPEDVILIDHFAHSSLVQGAKAVGCKIRPFLHNDPEHVKSILGKLKGFRQAFVVTESVFSTEGSIAPFGEIVETCARFQAIPVVDDSHGIGVLGKTGRGILEHCGIDGYDGLYTASFGKALANAGGFLAGRKTIVDLVQYHCPHLIYSTALPPGVLAGIEKVLELVGKEFGPLSQRMWENRKRIQSALLAAGFTLVPGEAPINSIVAGNPIQTVLLAKEFFRDHILTTPFVHPSVPLNEGRVRLIAGANLEGKTLEAVLAALPGIARRFRDLGTGS